MADNKKEYCPICSDRFNSQEEMLSHFESHSAEEKVKALKSSSVKRESKENTSFRKHSLLWYLLPLLMDFPGGLIGYLVINDDPDMATNLMIAGIVMTIIDIVAIWLTYPWLISHISNLFSI